MRISFGCGLLCGMLLLVSPVWSQGPVVNSLSPAAIQTGSPVPLLVRGTGLADVKGLWTSFPAQIKLAELPENGTKNDQVTFEVLATTETPVGIHAMRVWTPSGVSQLRFLLVDDLPTVAQAGNNTSPDTPQKLALPVAVDGTVGNLTVQYFQFSATEGQRLTFEVLARRIGSGLDPMLRILDPSGRELAFSDDGPGLSGDSQISHRFAAAGDYLLELRDIRYQGGPYRLRIGDFPATSVAYPLAVQRGSTANVSLAGIDVENVEPVSVTAPADPKISFWPVALKRAGGASSGFGQVAIADRAQQLEVEPNSQVDQANALQALHDINGRFDQAGDVDYFSFAAKKGESYLISGLARRQGSPADLVLKVLKPDGAELIRVDDVGVEEGSMTAKIPDDGTYTLVVEELTKRGGSDFAYRVEISPAAPAFKLGVSEDALNVPLGGSVLATVTAQRAGYNGPIEISVAGLPEGVTASRSVIGPGRNDAVLTLSAAPSVPAGAIHGVRVIGTGTGEIAPVAAEFSAALRTRMSNMRYPPAHVVEDLALAASPAPGFTWKAEPAELVFGKQLSTKTKLVVARGPELKEAVTVAIQPAQNGVPAGITVTVKPIAKDTNEVEIEISATDKAPLGDFTVGLLGTLKQDKTTVTQPIALRLSLTDPLTVSAVVGSEGKLPAAGELDLTVNIARNPALQGAVELTLANLPQGVTAAPVTIPADQSSAVVKLMASADAAKGVVKNVQVKSLVTVGAVKFESASGNLTITVE